MNWRAKHVCGIYDCDKTWCRLYISQLSEERFSLFLYERIINIFPHAGLTESRPELVVEADSLHSPSKGTRDTSARVR